MRDAAKQKGKAAGRKVEIKRDNGDNGDSDGVPLGSRSTAERVLLGRFFGGRESNGERRKGAQLIN